MKANILSLFILVFGYLLSACQMNPVRQFSKLQPGMEKDQVLELMGSPQKTLRRGGQDRWSYIFYDQQNKKNQKEVHFQSGFVVYIGEPLIAEVSAEEQDERNAASNRELEKVVLRDKQRSLSAPQDLEEEVRGTNEIRYVPVFTPVQ